MQKEKDNIRTKELIEKGFNVIRLWESEIRKLTLEDFKVKLNPMLIEVGS
jgi:very-short-patch-repair endonuclease